MAESDSTREGVVVSMASESGSHALLPAGEVLCQRCQMAVNFDWSVRKNSSIFSFDAGISTCSEPVRCCVNMLFVSFRSRPYQVPTFTPNELQMMRLDLRCPIDDRQTKWLLSHLISCLFPPSRFFP